MRIREVEDFPQRDFDDEQLGDAFDTVRFLAEHANSCDWYGEPLEIDYVIELCKDAAQAIIAAAKRREDAEQ